MIIDEKFSRLSQLLGEDALSRLHKAKVTIFGLGAVGSFALEALARSGIGEFILIDFDVVKPANFNRQLLALEQNLDIPKVVVAQERVKKINPRCKVKTPELFADESNLEEILLPSPGIVIDAIDSLKPKADLVAFCVKQKLPFISSLGAAGRIDPFSVRVGELKEATNCSLGRRLRKRLKSKGVFQGVRCVYSTQEALNAKGEIVKDKKEYRRGRERVPIGSVSYMTGIFGLVVAYEVLKMILGEELSGCSLGRAE